MTPDVMEPVRWGYPTLAHFFLAGIGGGTLAISALLLWFDRGRGRYFSVARYAAFIAPVVVLDDVVVLVLELGRPSRFLNIFSHVNFESPLWIGAWLMLFFLMISLAYAWTFLALPRRDGVIRRTLENLGVRSQVATDDGRQRLRGGLALLGLPLGIAVCHYPGFMMSGLVARPLWSTAVFPSLTLLSGVATGLAATLLCRVAFRRPRTAADREEYRDNNYRLTLAMLGTLLFEAILLTQLLVHARNSHGDLRVVVELLVSPGGLLAAEFWYGAVGIGLVVSLVTGLAQVGPRLFGARAYAAPRSLELLPSVSVLSGSLLLIHVLLFGGQLTGPLGL